MSNDTLIELVRDITVAQLADNALSANSKSGEETANFMQAIYYKLVELNKDT